MFRNTFYTCLLALVAWGSYQLSYPSNTPSDLYYEGIFLENTIEHVSQLTKGPRAVGDYYHDDVQRYIIKHLSKLGFSVSKQKSVAFNPKSKNAAPIRNIIAKYPGSDPFAKDLLLLAHYDAAKFSGTGAADDASGVAVILESLNAYFKTNNKPRNNLLVVFTDAEELGLLGAHAFINEQLNFHDIGLIINLEARGSSGPGMMWPETIGGNRAMIEAFKAAQVPMASTTSLHYEIYKKLPNDTDLTPFNEIGQINGFNIAFIDDHFNYHTRRDTLENLSINTLAHQNIQMFALLKHFSQAELDGMKTQDSLVYFSVPMIGLLSYPVWVNWLILIVSAMVFIVQSVVVYRNKKNQSITTAPLPYVIASISVFGFCWLLLKALYVLFPEFNDILQGFPYPSHSIILALLIGSALLTMAVFSWKSMNQLAMSMFHILFSLIVLTPLVYLLPGSGILLWPLAASVLLFVIQSNKATWAEQITPVFAVLIFLSFGSVLLINLPIAMGLRSLPFVALILVWLISLSLPIVSHVKKVFHVVLALLIPIGYLSIQLIQNPTISQSQPHPTSLSYLYDTDSDKAYFFNYDRTQSGWLADGFFENNPDQNSVSEFSSKYKKPVINLKETAIVNSIKPIQIEQMNSIFQKENEINLNLKANNDTEILEIYSNTPLTINEFIIDDRKAVMNQAVKIKTGQRLLRYYYNGKKSINLKLTIDQGETIDWMVQTHSLNLLTNDEFGIPQRPSHQIQKPFIASDNVITVQSLALDSNQ